MRTRDEHLEWAKQEARYYLDRGQPTEAITSICSDLSKHPDFQGIVTKLMPLALFYASQGNIDDARRFVDGFR